jgi:hypothetical protein
MKIPAQWILRQRSGNSDGTGVTGHFCTIGKADGQEGINALLEKREPKFEGC